MDEAEPIVHAITASSAQVESLCSLVVALALAGDSRAEAIFAEARTVADRLDNTTTNLERWTSYLDLMRALIYLKRYDEVEPLMPLVKHDKVRARLLDKLEKTLAESGNEQATTLLDQVRRMAQAIPEDLRQQALAPPDPATTLAQSNRHFAEVVGMEFSEAEHEYLATLKRAKMYDQLLFAPSTLKCSLIKGACARIADSVGPSWANYGLVRR